MSLVSEYLDKMEKRMAELDPVAVTRLEETATLDYEELFAAQQTQSALFAAGLIPQDVAQWVYGIVGEVPSPERFAQQPLAVRVTFIKLFQELLEMKMKLQQGGGRKAVA